MFIQENNRNSIFQFLKAVAGPLVLYVSNINNQSVQLVCKLMHGLYKVGMNPGYPNIPHFQQLAALSQVPLIQNKLFQKRGSGIGAHHHLEK